jgi:hypothetical protein
MKTALKLGKAYGLYESGAVKLANASYDNLPTILIAGVPYELEVT